MTSQHILSLCSTQYFQTPVIGLHLLLYKYSLLGPYMSGCNVPPSLPYALLSTPLLWLLNILQQHPWYITFSFFSPSVRCFFFFWLLALALDNLGVAFDCYPGKTTWSFPFLFLLFRTPFVRPGLIPFAWVQTRSKVKRDFFLGFFVILCPPNSW